jgi:chaperonin cofactor prefoldin
VGKAFVLTPTEEVNNRLEREMKELAKRQKDLEDKQEFLERRITSNTNNLRELTVGL